MEKVTGTVTVQRPGTNLPIVERWLSAAMGVLVALYGLRQKSAFGLGLLTAGGYLLYRGVTGRCHIYALIGLGDATDAALPVEQTPTSVEEGDEVTESSWASFPTSDPPSWTTGREKAD